MTRRVALYRYVDFNARFNTYRLHQLRARVRPVDKVQHRRLSQRLGCVKVHIYRESCVRSVQRTQMNVTRTLALPKEHQKGET
jgi:hypothetical protein